MDQTNKESEARESKQQTIKHSLMPQRRTNIRQLHGVAFFYLDAGAIQHHRCACVGSTYNIPAAHLL